MQQTAFSDIIAKLVVIVDYFLEAFVQVDWATNSTLANCSGGYYNGTLTACGMALVHSMAALTVQGLGAISGLMAGLSVVSYLP